MFHNMWNADEGFLAATHELMLLHVDQNVGRTAPMPDDVRRRLAEVVTSNAGRPPEHVGSMIRAVG